ncbi:hypothetical protein TNCV_778061 [Trichonephila clavipes]|nr:hypothetical protein TNCV_778061 [Trichonephila clavipes]
MSFGTVSKIIHKDFKLKRCLNLQFICFFQNVSPKDKTNCRKLYVKHQAAKKNGNSVVTLDGACVIISGCSKIKDKFSIAQLTGMTLRNDLVNVQKSTQSCQVIYSQFGLAIHQNDHQARCRLVEWAQNEIAVVPDFHKRILFSDEAHFWLNGYVNKQNCRIWSEANPQVYVETPLHPEKLTVWCALWAGGILLQKR